MRKKRRDNVDEFISKYTKPSHVKPLKRWHGEVGLVSLNNNGEELVAAFNDKNPNWRFKLIEDLDRVIRMEVWYGWDGQGIRSANANDLDRLLRNAGWARDQFAIDTLENITVREVGS